MELLSPGVDVPAGFAVAVVLSGAGGTHRDARGRIAVATGQTLVVPASYGDWHLEGDARLLVCRPGDSWPPQSTEGLSMTATAGGTWSVA